MRPLIDRYRWVDDPDLDLAWTVATITGRTADEVVQTYGGDPADPVGELTYEGAGVPYDDFGKYFHLQILVPDGHVVAIENNGWSGTLPETGRRASANGAAFFSVYWSPSADRLMQAVDGTVTAYFNPLRYDPADDRFDVYPAWAAGAGLEHDGTDAGPICMALMEQQTGLAFQPEWLDLALPTYRIPDPHALFRDVPGAESARRAGDAAGPN